jgi:cytochrome c oxidase cbb3-type subunit 4
MTLVEISGFARSMWPAWMILLFAGIALWAFWPANRKRFDLDSRIPLNDDAEN